MLSEYAGNARNTFVTYDSTMNFISDASDYIAKYYKEVWVG